MKANHAPRQGSSASRDQVLIIGADKSTLASETEPLAHPRTASMSALVRSVAVLPARRQAAGADLQRRRPHYIVAGRRRVIVAH